MPLYEYQCKKCSTVYEALIRRSEDEAAECCPECGSKRKAKMFSVFGMAGVEKGGGGSCGSCSGGSCGSCSCH